MSFRLGTITIGQSPRQDVIPEMLPYLGTWVEILEAGALDGLSYEEIQTLKPEQGDYVLVSTQRDGREVKFAEKHILGRLQDCIDRLEEKKVQAIAFICTGKFPDIFRASVPLIYPQVILHRIVPELSGTKKIGVVIPDPEQIEQTRIKWKDAGLEARVIPWSPYDKKVTGTLPDLTGFSDPSLDLIIMDCIGYTAGMKQLVLQETHKPVILARTLVARILGELGDS
ncbi:MAG: AroM family protein [Clostridiaceae bacterium]